MSIGVESLVGRYFKIKEVRQADFKSDVKNLFDRAIGLSDTNPELAKYLFSGENSDRIDVQRSTFKTADLRPSQTTMDLELALDVTLAVLRDNEVVGDLNSIVSSDNYIMDGHHRWAAMTMAFGRKARVIAYQADLDSEKLIRVLNIITRGLLGKEKGNKGTGSLKDFTPMNVRKAMFKLLRKGTLKGSFHKSPKEIKRILIMRFGSVHKGVEHISNNARLLTLTVPSWAPDRSDMPVIEEDEVPLTEALLEGGWDTDVRAPRKPSILAPLEGGKMPLRFDRNRPTIPNFRFSKENDMRRQSSAKQHHEEMMAKFRMPRLDRDRYTPLKGMEGPFQFRGGEILYYDPREGKYYDRDADMYLSDRDSDRITSRTAHKLAGSGLKSVQALLPGTSNKEANKFLHALSALVVDGDVLKMDLKKVKGEIEVEVSSGYHPSSPSLPDNDFIEGTTGVLVKMVIEVELDDLERLADMNLADMYLDDDPRSVRNLCDAITKNINGNILRNMDDDQLNLAFGDVQHEVEYDIPEYHNLTHLEILEHDYKVMDLDLKGDRHIIAHVLAEVEYGIFVELDQDAWEKDKY